MFYKCSTYISGIPRQLWAHSCVVAARAARAPARRAIHGIRGQVEEVGGDSRCRQLKTYAVFLAEYIRRKGVFGKQGVLYRGIFWGVLYRAYIFENSRSVGTRFWAGTLGSFRFIPMRSMRPHAAQMSPPPPFQLLVDWGALWASIGPLIGAISLPIDWPIGNQLDLLVLSSIGCTYCANASNSSRTWTSCGEEGAKEAPRSR
jgi:hypothetical protein